MSADFFNEGSGQALVHSVQCVGNETMLLDCPNVLQAESSCPRAGVTCQGMYVNIYVYA